MNCKQFEVWEKQKEREYKIELSKLREDFASRGLTFSGLRNKTEEDLKVKYDSEIEITRLGINDNKGPVAINIGKLDVARIEGNKVYGMSLLKADEVKDSSIKNNRTYDTRLNSRNIDWQKRGVIVAFMGVLATLFF